MPQVTPQGDGYFCEFDGKTYERMERRYVLLVKASDATGEAYLNMFNEQVLRLLFWLNTVSPTDASSAR